MDNSAQGKNGSKKNPSESTKASTDSQASPNNTKTSESISIDHPKKPISASAAEQKTSTETKADANGQKTTATTAKASQPAVKTASATINSATAQPTASAVASPKTTTDNVAFKSSDIGVKTAVKQDPFAEQNKKAAEKKSKAAAKRKKTTIILAVIIGLAIIALVVWGIIMIINANRPEDPRSTPAVTGTALEVKNAALAAYNKDEGAKDAAAAEQVFTDAIDGLQNEVDLNSADGQEAILRQVAELLLAKMVFYTNVQMFDRAVATSSDIDENYLTGGQLATYYNIIAVAYSEQGDEEKANEFYQKAYEKRMEVGGYGG